ncbi:hypothetical protein DICVIV_08717 [Dictyocaulus viviparus]|uniref:Polymerase nucleotidyl transferase domain-containing protein n=1 Tax=Dictyocaulus viviparus TaxID=29172 RepID=A0A0D8XNB8_DICVI|nr:hypothetical protein DICVIV_08717 [Dictyocaulus viviparus]
MIGKILPRQIAAAFRTNVFDSKKGRVYASFIESMKEHHQLRLQSLDRKLKEVDEFRKANITNSTIKIIHHLSHRVLSRNSRFVQVGSSVNGLSCDNSDIDLVFFPTDAARRNSFMKDFFGNGDFKTSFMTVMSRIVTRELNNIGVPVESSVALHHLRVGLYKYFHECFVKSSQ